jgi:hypothetical protein
VSTFVIALLVSQGENTLKLVSLTGRDEMKEVVEGGGGGGGGEREGGRTGYS